MATKHYMAPLLANAEILLCLQELCGQPFPETAITKPDPETVAFILEHLVERLVGVSREELNSTVPDALAGIEFPNLHEHSIPNMTFLRYLCVSFDPRTAFLIKSALTATFALERKRGGSAETSAYLFLTIF